jgi:hypothetical protein
MTIAAAALWLMTVADHERQIEEDAPDPATVLVDKG